MNLKTSLKTVVSTLFELKLPVLGLLMLLFCITACNQHEVLSPTDSSTEPLESLEALNLSDEEATFFSDNNVGEIIQFRTFDELNRSGQERLLFHDAILQTKQFMRRMNLQMEDKYISHIVQNIGQPAWLASYVIDLENGCSLTFIPIVEDGSEKVAGVISYYKGENDKSAYSLTTRHQIATATQDDYDPNYNFLIQMFYEFDKQLFAYEGEEYNEWARRRWWTYPIYHDSDCIESINCLEALRTSPTNRIVHGFGGTAFDATPFTGIGLFNDLCFVYCSSGCSDGVYNAGIVDTAEEATWLSGSCGYANILDNFLEDNDEPGIGQILLDAAILGYLTFTESRTLTNAIEDYLNDPDNANTDAACVVQGTLENLGGIYEVSLTLICEMSTDLMAAKFSSDYEVYNSCVPADIQLIRASIVNCQNSNGNCLCPTFDCILNNLMVVEDVIIKDESFTNCERVNCVYDVLFDSMNELFCSTIGNFMESTIFDLRFEVANILGDGETTYDEESNIIILTVDDFFCDENESTDLNVAATILHEGIHAELRRYLMDKGYNANDVESYPEVWDNYLVEWYAENSGTINDIHHAIMVRVDNYVELIAEALWQLNGQVFTIDHYKHLAWDGLRGYSEQYADDTYGNNTPFYPLHQELMASNPTLGCDQ